MSTRCETCQERLLDLLYGEIEAGVRREVEAHLASCATCRAERDRLEATRLVLRLLPEERPARGIEAILQAAEREARLRAEKRGAGPLVHLGRWLRLHPFGVTAALAATVLLLVVSIDPGSEGVRLVGQAGEGAAAPPAGMAGRQVEPSPEVAPVEEAPAVVGGVREAQGEAKSKEDKATAGRVAQDELSKSIEAFPARGEGGTPPVAPHGGRAKARRRMRARRRAEARSEPPRAEGPGEGGATLEDAAALRRAPAEAKASDTRRSRGVEVQAGEGARAGVAKKKRPTSAEPAAAPGPTRRAPARARPQAPRPAMAQAVGKGAGAPPVAPAPRGVVAAAAPPSAPASAESPRGGRRAEAEADRVSRAAGAVQVASEGAAPSAREDDEGRLRRARRLVEGDRCAEALPLLDVLVTSSKAQVRAGAYFYRGLCRRRSGDLEAARSDLALAASLDAGRYSRKARRALRALAPEDEGATEPASE